MRLIRSLDVPDLPLSRVVALGNFDGLHRGHAHIFSHARTLARKLGHTPLVFTFDPHPLKVLRGAGSVRLLQSVPQKLNTLSAWGFEEVVLFPFTHDFSMLTPEQFMRDILLDRLRVAGVVVGTLFNFGHDRKGDAPMLEEFGRAHGFPVIGVPPIRHKGHVISSTWIRKCIEDADLAEASELLGRPYSIDGTVVEGDHRGSALGFPTANIVASHDVLPPSGVYLTACLLQDTLHPALTNIGYRPTFGSSSQLLIETHLLDFSGDLYARDIELFFLARLRDEARYESATALTQQLEADRAAAREFFSRQRLPPLSVCRPLLPEADAAGLTPDRQPRSS